MPKAKIKCKTLFLSDLHLGTPDAKAEQVVWMLKRVRCEKLVLNGDIIDGWHLRRKGGWLNEHTKVIREILKMIEKRGTEVVYLRGNHDDILGRFLPVDFGNFRLADEYIHETPLGNYLVVHGDGFDNVCSNHKWLAVLGSWGYDQLLRFNRIYNRWRAWRGREYFSVSQRIKARVKGAVSFVGRYEEQLQRLARARRCVGIICGHIHTPEDKRIGEIHYLNSGDWVESMTAVIEWDSGQFQVIRYSDLQDLLEIEETRRRNRFMNGKWRAPGAA